MKFEDRPYQLQCADEWYAASLKEGIHPIVAVPTGAGKSIILGLFIKKYLSEHPDDRILVLSHTQEILEQDHTALQNFFPDMEIGLYSAGLDSRTSEQITVAGIQSVYKRKDEFRWFNVIAIDECHTLNHKGTGMYRDFLKDMYATIIGMSATIFRSGHGFIHTGKGALFNELAYDLTSTLNFNKLVKDGYLCDLISVAPKTQLDSSKVKKTGGDYNLKELAKTHDKESITKAAVDNAVYYGKNYSKWLCFATDIQHCDHIAAELVSRGITARVLHSRMDAERSDTIQDFKDGKFRCMVSVGMATTGLDVPDIDMILMLRPTMSAVLHVQMIGRGLRVHTDKKHCLVLDYAGNTARLGPINNVVLPKRKGEKGGGEAPTKTCPVCSTIMYTMAKNCSSCGHEFVFEVKITAESDTTDIIARDTAKETKSKWLKVKSIRYNIHRKTGAPDSMMVTYICGIQTIKEWVCISHGGYAGHKAKHWANYRGYQGPVNTGALYKASSKLKQPTSLLIDFAPRFPTILNSRFD